MHKSMCMNYHEIVIDKSITDNELEKFNDDDIQDYMICLPILQNGKQQEQTVHHSLYYVIDDKWMEMDEKCEAITPT